MKAHDVRHLVICAGCSDPGDKRHMVVTQDEHWHGRCYINRYGIVALCDLPDEVTRVLTLGDIGPDAMRALLPPRMGGWVRA